MFQVFGIRTCVSSTWLSDDPRTGFRPTQAPQGRVAPLRSKHVRREGSETVVIHRD